MNFEKLNYSGNINVQTLMINQHFEFERMSDSTK